MKNFQEMFGYREYQMPGGQPEKGETDLECLKREIKEELNCDIKQDTIKYIGEYNGPAAGGGLLDMKLYQAELIGTPVPSHEIMALHWIGAEDITNLKVSTFIRTRILPDLIKRGILKRIKE